MKTLVLFDLELTLFDEWGSFVPMNERSVSLYVSNLPNDCMFGLYSWAVYDEKDKQQFVEDEQEWVENMFGFKFNDEFLFTLDDVMKMVQSTVKSVNFDRKGFFEFFSKETSMMQLLKLKQFKDMHLVLVDDTVQNMEVFNKDNNSKLTFVQVNDLPSF
jgi:FMN phosphatase YigB (HAD superfamily)